MGCCTSTFEEARQDQFAELVNTFPSSSITAIRDDAPGLPQMVTGRISAPNGVLTSPISGSPCVAYFYEISEYGFNGMMEKNGYGFTKIYSEKKNIAFELIDPQNPDHRVQVGANDSLIAINKSSSAEYTTEILTDVALAHVCPVPSYTYDVPRVVHGDIQATKNLIRGYPLKFGMLDGEGDGIRVEVPENIEQLFANANISRFKEKSTWRKLRESCGKKYDEDEYRTFALTEMTIRVNDQMSLIASFMKDDSNEKIMKAVPVRSDAMKSVDNTNPWVSEAVKKIFTLTAHEKAIVLTKFPKVSEIKPLPKGLIWSQEQGVFSNFVLQETVEANVKNMDFRSGLVSPDARGGDGRENMSPDVATSEQKQARAYLFSDAGNERLGNAPVHHE